MNKVERFVYDLVKSNPKIKKIIRNIYQAFFDLMPKGKDYSINPIILKEGFFFGFHEVQAFSKDNSKVLAVRYNYEEIRMPNENDFAEVGYLKFDGNELGEFVKLGETNAWNFHKGCRLQWVNDSEFIFNCVEAGKLVSKIINIEDKTVRIIPLPIDTVSLDGKYATSFSYERLEKHMPGYGYCHKDDYSHIEDKAPSSTGLYLMNLETQESKLLIDLHSLANLTKNSKYSTEWNHYVTHTEFSQDSRFISFLHRWSGEYKGKRFTEFMLYDLKSGELSRIPTTNLMTSHYAWNSKGEIIAYCNFKGTDSHVLFKIDELERSHAIAYPQINSDGHQSFINDYSFVTDTYPDKHRMAKLWKVDVISNKKELLASVYSPKKFQSSLKKGHVACDLHPIISHDGKFVCFDTVHTGKRAIAIMKLD